MSNNSDNIQTESAREVRTLLGDTKSLVLIGLMGAGKSSIGRRLAERLEMPFKDADSEIEAAAGCTVAEFFEAYGEAEFRDGERRVIQRLLEGDQIVLATGGGAFMNEETRGTIRDKAITIWMKADLDVLVRRTSRRKTRPLLLSGNPEDILRRLMTERHPVYEKADVIIESRDVLHDVAVDAVVEGLETYLKDHGYAHSD